MPVKDVVALAAGYGTVTAAFDGVRLVEPRLPPQQCAPLEIDLAITYNSQRYCQIITRIVPWIYRLVDETKEPDARDPQLPQPGRRAAYYLLHTRDSRGAWMSPLRPTYLQDYRRSAAIQPEWNKAHAVMECTLGADATAYVGRAGPQGNPGRYGFLPGGAVQFWVPASEFFRLSFSCWWIPE
jgi:hypothetical protein